MNELAKVVLIVAALLLSGVAAAQTFKCQDPAGKITYSNSTCSKLGLKDAGEVRNRINVQPSSPSAGAPPQPSSDTPRRSSDTPRPSSDNRPQRPAAPAKAEEPRAAEAPPGDESGELQRRCFTVQTPKGAITRCNDTPQQ